MSAGVRNEERPGGFLLRGAPSAHQFSGLRFGSRMVRVMKWWSALWRSGALVAAAAGLLVGCGEGGTPKPSQAVARVNKDELTVHQINYALQQMRGLSPEASELASRSILDRLIDQEVAIQAAKDVKLDRDPQVLQSIEAARRELIARAYADRVAQSIGRPTPEEVQQFYNEKPNLFRDRKIFDLFEVSIEATPEVKARISSLLAAATSKEDFVRRMSEDGIKFSVTPIARPAEQIPLAILDRVAALRPNASFIVEVPPVTRAAFLLGSRPAPVSFEQARPAIEQFMLNERKKKAIEANIKALRSAAQIELMGKFASLDPAQLSAAGAASGPALKPANITPAAMKPPALVVPPPRPGGLDQNEKPNPSEVRLEADTIQKGLGIK